MFGQAWYSAAPCSPSHSPHTFPPKNAARCDGLCSVLHRPSQRAAMRDAPHYVFCLTLAHDLPPCAPGLHPTLSAPPTEPAIFLSEMRQTGLGNAGRQNEEQAWYKSPYPPVKACICARFLTEALWRFVSKSEVSVIGKRSWRAYRAVLWRFRVNVRPPTRFSATYRGCHRRDSPSTSHRADDACGRNGTCHAATVHRHRPVLPCPLHR